MTTTVLIWLQLSYVWGGGATFSAGPMLWTQVGEPDSYVADTVTVEPCSVSYETATREIAVETRIEASILAWPR